MNKEGRGESKVNEKKNSWGRRLQSREETKYFSRSS